MSRHNRTLVFVASLSIIFGLSFWAPSLAGQDLATPVPSAAELEEASGPETPDAVSKPDCPSSPRTGIPELMYFPPNDRNRVVPGRNFVLQRRDNSGAEVPEPNAAWLIQVEPGKDSKMTLRALSVPVHNVGLTLEGTELKKQSLVIEVPDWKRVRTFFSLPVIPGMWRSSRVTLCLGVVDVAKASGVFDLSTAFRDSPPASAAVVRGWPVEPVALSWDLLSSPGQVCSWFAGRSKVASPTGVVGQGRVVIEDLGGLEVEMANKYSSLLWALFGLLLLWLVFWLVLLRLECLRKGKLPNPFSALTCILDVDGRASLSRLQMAIWTLVTGFGLIFVWAMDERFIEIPNDVIGFLGIGGATLTVRNYLRSVDSSNVPSTQAWTGKLGDLLLANGKPDLSRIQMLFFTVVIPVFVLKEIVEHGRFPDFDPNVVALTGVSSATYLLGSKKYAKSNSDGSSSESKPKTE